MNIDPLTLTVAGSFVGCLSGITLLTAWLYLRAESALLWWALASFVYATGIGLLAATPLLPQPGGLLLGLGLINFAPPLVWAGVRHFGRKSAPFLLVAAGPALWLVAGAFGDHATSATIVGFLAWIAYLAAASWELWRGRGERLVARLPLLGLFVLHAAVICGGLVDVLTGRLADGAAPTFSGWFGIINLEGLVYFMGTALLMVGLATQRKEHQSVQAAHVNSLTGAVSRGEFLDRAERLLNRCRQDGAPLAMLMFDLDRFKSINDSHGHAAGDQVIRAFSDAARKALRSNDLFGRYGGEEFAAILPGTTIEVAYVIAERVRHNFADTGIDAGGIQIYATVSGGVAVASDEAHLRDVIEAADRALYLAKNRGRNRIVRADDGDSGPRDNVIRVA